MTKHSSTQTGFAILEALLIVVIVALVAFTGYFIYSSNKKANDTLDAAAKVAQSAKATHTTKKPKQISVNPAAETDSWLLYESPGKEYTIRLADGWQLTRYMKTVPIVSGSNANVALKPGVKATVTEIETGKDGLRGFFLNYSSESSQKDIPGSPQAGFKTDDGLEVAKYHYVQTAAGEAGFPDQLAMGGQRYDYVITKATHKTVFITYTFEPGETDYHDTVEKVVKTVHIN